MFNKDQIEFMKDLKQWATDFGEAQTKQMKQTLEATAQTIKKLLDDSDSQSSEPLELTDDQVTAIGEKIEEGMSGRKPKHPVGLCEQDDCEICAKQRKDITWQALQKIEERVPGTKDAVAAWQVLHTPIEIEVTEEELEALKAA